MKYIQALEYINMFTMLYIQVYKASLASPF